MLRCERRTKTVFRAFTYTFLVAWAIVPARALADSPSAPTYSFGNSPSTGFYTPGPGTAAFATNGTARLTLNGGGLVGIGTSVPAATLDIFGIGAQSSVLAPRDSTTNRPTGLNGMFRYNTTTSAFEFFQNNAWVSYGTGSGAGSVTSLVLGSGLVSGTITTAGTINVNVGTGAGQVTQENSAAQIAQALGSVTSPAFSFALNTTTGLYSPGTNALALATNGTARLMLDNKGYIGVGTSSPIEPLDLEFSSTTPLGLVIQNNNGGTSGNASLYIQNYGNGSPFVQMNQLRGTSTASTPTQNGDSMGFIQMQGYNGSALVGGAAIWSYAEATFGAGTAPSALVFYTTPTTSTSATEHFRIAGSGNIGIGSSAPVNLLDIGASYGSGSIRQAIQINDDGIGTPSADGSYSNGDKLVMWNGASGTQVKNAMGNDSWGMWVQSSGNSSSHVGIWTGATQGAAPTERLRVDSAGNVGIGTTSPAATLEVAGKVAMSGTAPAINSCGGSGGSVAGSDSRGTVTMGSTAATSCSITFNSAYASTPVCVAIFSATASSTTTITLNASTTGLTFYFSASVTSRKVNYICFQ